VFEFRFLQSLLGLNGPLYFGKPSSGPTAQQQALATSQATTTANQNLEENEQRKIILNAMQGTRVFRGSALSRSIASNQAGTAAPTAPPGVSGQQQNGLPITAGSGTSLLDLAGGTQDAVPGARAAGTTGTTGAGGGAGRGGGNR
jgi:hypothetical protein